MQNLSMYLSFCLNDKPFLPFSPVSDMGIMRRVKACLFSDAQVHSGCNVDCMLAALYLPHLLLSKR